MKILIVGNGGRESAIAHTVRRFHRAEIFVAPGNGGTEDAFTNIPIKVEELEVLANFAEEKQVDITIVGPYTTCNGYCRCF